MNDSATIRECDCHHRRHRDDKLIAVMRQDNEIDVDPQVSGGIVWYCPPGFRQRERERKARGKRRERRRR